MFQFDTTYSGEVKKDFPEANMTRTTTVSTAIGLVGLTLAMATPLISAAPSALLALGFGMVALGLFGAVIGAAASLGHARQTTRH